MHTGNQMQEKIRSWLSPPDPSVNHNTACKTQHLGTATWFIQSTTFEDWKKNGSLLWVRGNRTLLWLFEFFLLLIYSFILQPVREKAFYGVWSFAFFGDRNLYFVLAPPLLRTSRICERPGRR